MTPPTANVRLLLIDDDEDDFVILRDVLGEIPGLTCTLDWEKSFRTGLAATLERRHDVYLIDYQLGEEDGLSIVRAACARGVVAPMILLTGLDNSTVDATAAEAGAVDYLVKAQLTPAALGRSLRYALARAGDARERDGLREQLIVADRMAAMGTLAAGVAHEINNPLASVLANAEVGSDMLRAVLATCPPGVCAELTDLTSVLADIQTGAERVRAIVGDLKVFARPDLESRKPVDLNRVIDSALELALHDVRHRATVVRELGAIPLVFGNETHLGQVFLNLFLNAAQALPNDNLCNRIVVQSFADGQGRAVVEVRDTGSGIAPEHLGRVFDPFFTTKAVGVGTGLGLSICHGIMHSLGGQIRVESELGRGSTFTLVFPAAKEVSSPKPEPKLSKQEAKLRGRVLVVDDEPSVGRVLLRTLSAHEVHALTSGAEALEWLGRGERFDLILCDLMMPGLTGMDLHAAVLLRVPEQAERMVFLTGGAVTPRAQVFLEQMPNRWLEKPFNGEQLRAVVQEALARGAS